MIIGVSQVGRKAQHAVEVLWEGAEVRLGHSLK
jgi:hypothetical protein